MPTPGRLARLADALDDRAGLRKLWAAIANERVPGGARFAYVFGSALLITFGIQALTGFTLATAYSPSTTDAWGSVFYIQNEMTLGWLVRGIHHFGSSAMIVLCVLHMTQVFFYGAYRKPRELNWILGVVMLLLVLGFGLTGYLLPWDQKGYWATQVATSIMGSTPGGGFVQALLQGGAEYGNHTLTRFYAIHVFVLPISLTLLAIGHVGLFRRHGVTPRPDRSDEALAAKVHTFWPFQVLYDLLFAAVVFAVLVALVLGVGVSLEAPADPSSAYEARPEWYFLFLFQLLKYFEGPMALIGTVVIPTLGCAFLFVLPLLDRRPDGRRAWPARRVAIPFVLMILGAGGLMVAAMAEDAGSDSFQAARAKADRQAALATEAADLGGIDPSGRVTLYAGLRLFREKGCATCHKRDTETPAPLLADYGSPRRLRRFLTNPDHETLFGRTPLAKQMPPVAKFKPGPTDTEALVAYLLSLSGRVDGDAAQVAQGGAFFKRRCVDCHNHPDWDPLGDDYDFMLAGPDLRGFLSYDWVRGLVRNPNSPTYFGVPLAAPDKRKRAMPDYEDLSPDELDLLTRWLLAGAFGAE